MLRFPRAWGGAGRLVGVAVVALGAHACAYQSLRPPGHGYLVHYQPAVLLCGLLALLLLAGALGACQ